MSMTEPTRFRGEQRPPDGVYLGDAILDDDGHGAEDVYIRAKVTKQGSDLEVDLSAFSAGAIPKIPVVEIRP